MDIMTHISDLGNSTFLQVFSYLSPQECAQASLVDRQWRQLAQDDLLWQAYVRQVLALEAPLRPDGTLCSTYRQAFCEWAGQVAPLTPTVCTALQAWGRIKAWLSSNYVEVLESLNPGVSRAEVEAAEQELGCVVPEQVLAIFKVHNGQLLKWDGQLDNKYLVTGCQERWAAIQAAEQARKERGKARAAGSGSSGSGSGSGAAPVSDESAQQPGDDGDDDDEEEHRQTPPSLFHGLFGGYAFYDHLAVTRLLPLSRAVWWTKHLRERGALVYGDRPCLVVAASFNFRKFFLVDLQHCGVYVNHHRSSIPAAPAPGCPVPVDSVPGSAAEPRPMTSGQEPAAAAAAAGASGSSAAAPPAGRIISPSTRPGSASSSAPTQSGSLMTWFQEYARRLAQGWYTVQPLDQDYDASKGICLFPCVPPALTSAVTRGVCIMASSVYAAEVSQQGKNLFTYRIRMRLQSDDEQQAAIQAASLAEPSPGDVPGRLPYTSPVQQCQLMTRHWVIRDEANQQMDEVRGEGVIGKFPILTSGGPEFSYQSCTHQSGSLGYMEGQFRFVQGTLVGRSGMEWDVHCPRFELRIPDFIF